MLENGLTAHACRHTATNARQERVTSVRVRFFSVGHEAKQRASFIRLRSFYVFPFFFFFHFDESSRNLRLINSIRSRRFLFFFSLQRDLICIPSYLFFQCLRLDFSLSSVKEKRGNVEVWKVFALFFSVRSRARKEKWKKCAWGFSDHVKIFFSLSLSEISSRVVLSCGLENRDNRRERWDFDEWPPRLFALIYREAWRQFWRLLFHLE